MEYAEDDFFQGDPAPVPSPAASLRRATDVPLPSQARTSLTLPAPRSRLVLAEEISSGQASFGSGDPMCAPPAAAGGAAMGANALATAAFLEPMALSGSPDLLTQIEDTLNPIVDEHRRLFTLVTEGTRITVVRSPTDSEEVVQRTPARAADMYVTPDLRSIVWSGLADDGTGPGFGTFCVRLSELTGLVCLEAHHVLPDYRMYPQVSRTSPVIRIMVRGTTTHWDCVLRDGAHRDDWLAGIALAYGIQTVPSSANVDA